MQLSKMFWKSTIAIAGFIMIWSLHPSFNSRLDAGEFLTAHIMLEFFSIAISYAMALYCWAAAPYLKSLRFVALGAAFFSVGSMDIVHTISYKGMPVFAAIDQVQSATWFWILARMTEAVSLTAVFFINDKTVNFKKWRTIVYASAAAYCLALIWLIIKCSPSLPVLVIEGQGVTPLKVGLEYAITAVHLLAAALIIRGNEQRQGMKAAFIEALIFISLGELIFTIYKEVYDLENLLGHIYKAIGYYLILSYMLVPFVALPFKREQAISELLLESEERFRNSFVHSAIGMAIVTLGGRWLTVNPSFCSMLGYSEDELTAMTFHEITHPEDRGLDATLLQNLVDGEVNSFQEEKRYYHKTGRIVRVLWNVALIRDAGQKPLYFVSQIQDLTDYHKALEQAQHVARLESEIARLDRLNTLSQIAASISHEVRNPMTTVRGYLQMLRRRTEFDQYKERIDLMVEEIDRANTIITEFLSLSKNKPADKQMQSLNSIISAIFPLLQANALEQGMELELVLGDVPNLPLDSKAIRQIIFNLVQNGLEAMQPGGCLTISTSKDEKSITLAFMDTGTGIPEYIRDRIGTPFLTTKEGGTGLGLGICFKIAEQHMASVDFDTGPGGTAFYVRFPYP